MTKGNLLRLPWVSVRRLAQPIGTVHTPDGRLTEFSVPMTHRGPKRVRKPKRAEKPGRPDKPKRADKEDLRDWIGSRPVETR